MFLSTDYNAGADDSVLSEDRFNETELTDLDGQLESPPKNYLSVEEENNVHHPHNDVIRAAQEHDVHDSEYDSHGEDKMIARKHSHHWHHKHSHHSHGHCHSGKDLKDTGIANIAWMVIMGDGIHNFSDGLAIGRQKHGVFFNSFSPHMLSNFGRILLISDHRFPVSFCGYWHCFFSFRAGIKRPSVVIVIFLLLIFSDCFHQDYFVGISNSSNLLDKIGAE